MSDKADEAKRMILDRLRAKAGLRSLSPKELDSRVEQWREAQPNKGDTDVKE